MGRNAYINFYIWFYNEHRGQAPVTTIAKRAGVTWRKMTPQERDRFTYRINYPKGNVPLYLSKRKKGSNNTVTSKKQRKTGIKSTGHSNQRPHLKKVRNGRVKTGEQEKLQVNSNHQIQGKDKTEETQTDQNDDSNENSGEEAEPEEIIAKRKSIQRWMDKNHYT